jgi:hypothetical protein
MADWSWVARGWLSGTSPDQRQALRPLLDDCDVKCLEPPNSISPPDLLSPTSHSRLSDLQTLLGNRRNKPEAEERFPRPRVSCLRLPASPQPSPRHRYVSNMSNLIDSEAGSELFSSYESELKLVEADLNQKLDQIPELSGEPRKAAVRQAERALEEATELV